MRVQTKLLILIVPLIALPPTLVGIHAYQQQTKAALQRLTAQALNRVAHTEGAFVERLRGATAAARDIAADPRIGAFLAELQSGSGSEITRAGADGAISTRLAAVPGARAVLFTSLGEAVLSNTTLPTASYRRQPAAPKPGSRPAWLRDMRARQTDDVLVYSQDVRNGSSEAAEAATEVDVIAPVGAAAGYVEIAVPVVALSAKAIAPAPGYLFGGILDPSRRIVSADDDALNLWRIAPEELTAMLTAGTHGALEVMAIDGIRYAAAARPLGHGYAGMVLFEPAVISRLNAPIAWTAAIVTLLAVLAACAGLGFGLRRLVLVPLEKLRSAATAFGAGDLSSPVSIDEREDEIGILGASLEQMRRNLNDSQDSAHRLINQDALTGLPNRRSITERLDAEIERARRSGAGRFALMFIDLDNFKAINDSMGHEAGDRLVIKVAQRLVEGLRAYDSVGIDRRLASVAEQDSGEGQNFVARLGGDEFLVIIKDIDDPSHLARVAERIYGFFKEPLFIDELQFRVSMSVGIAMYPNDGDSAGQLIKSADVAMYSAKTAGKNQYRYYDRSMDSAARDSLEIETELRRALSENRLELHFQPQVSLPTREVEGCEVLLRWHHPERGWVSPAEFIPVAESCGLIHEVGNWVLAAAFEQLRDWRESGFDAPRVAINLSSYQVASGGMVDRVREVANRLGIGLDGIEFELTETAIFGNAEVAQQNLAGLRALGARIALDDFGTGYSSLAWVNHATVDTIKIDRSFVTDILSDERHEAIVASVVELSRRLGLTTVAEGIETEQQAVALNRLGCTSAQGYLFGRALPADEFRGLVELAREEPNETPQAAAQAAVG